jgi:hypothetical protein
VHAPLHRGNGDAPCHAKHKASGVAGNGREREMRKVAVGNYRSFAKRIRKRPQAGTQDYPQDRLLTAA